MKSDLEGQGGFQMFARKGRSARECAHSTTINVRNSGIERTVCESCGHVSFRGLEGLSGRADRRQFEREIERTESVG